MTCPKCQHPDPTRFGTYGARKIQRFRCKDCGATFSPIQPNPLGRHHITIDQATYAITLLCEGMSVRAVSRLTGLHKNTVLGLLLTIGEKCERLFDRLIQNIAAKRVQCDEIWCFVGSKQKNVPDDKIGLWGDIWTWTALDADSKLIIAYRVGARTPPMAYEFMKDLARRLAAPIQLTTDGLPWYVDAVDHAFGIDVDYAMVQKHYAGGIAGSSTAAVRYSPTRFVNATKEIIWGDPDPKHISTSHVERQNLSMRMHMRRFTRLTNAFSKSPVNHAAMVSLYFMFYNVCRVHQTLRVTPAMEAGVTDHVWTVAELLCAEQ